LSETVVYSINEEDLKEMRSLAKSASTPMVLYQSNMELMKDEALASCKCDASKLHKMLEKVTELPF